jgi:tRNA(fMet)-specific endonuclease VapC
VTAERAGAAFDTIIGDEDDVAIAAVTVAELRVGVDLADRRNRQRRTSSVDDVLSAIPIKPYELEVARVHATLLAHTRRSGRPRGAHALLIAATAIARRRLVVSADPTGFAELPGVAVRLPA